VPAIKDEALIIDTPDGLAAVVGCSRLVCEIVSPSTASLDRV